MCCLFRWKKEGIPSDLQVNKRSAYRIAACEACNKIFHSADTRIQVKGASWMGDCLEPLYRIFSFCPTEECLKRGISNMQHKGSLFPSFHKKIALNSTRLLPRIADVQFIPVSDGFLSEKFYIFKP